MKELVGKYCKVYVRNLTAPTEKPIIYTAEVEAIDELGENVFIRILDRYGKVVRLNLKDIIQITEINEVNE